MNSEKILEVVDQCFGRHHYDVANENWIMFARAILQAATRDAPSADAVVQILKDEQQWLASSRDNCDEDELQRWDRIQVAIDYVAPKGDGND